MKKTTVALVCNMNNNMFAFTRYLRELGFDAHLFLLNNEFAHFLPECDTFDLSHRSYTHSLDFGNPYWFLDELKRVESEQAWQVDTLKSFDKIIACGSAMGFLEYFDIAVDVFVPYGADVYELPFYIPSANPKHREHLDSFSPLQATAIKRAKAVLTTYDFVHVPQFADSLTKLDCNAKTKGVEYFPFIYHPIYVPENISHYFHRSYWAHEFKAIREQADVIVFSHPRHVWRNKSLISNKGNDSCIRGFADFVAEYSSARLILFEYGSDVAASKTLVKDLGIADKVLWMPQMNRKDIMIGIHYSDIVAEAFTQGNSMGGAVGEALIAHKPLLKFTNMAYTKGRTIYTHLNAHNASEITARLCDFVRDGLDFSHHAQENFAWLERERERALSYLLSFL